MNNDYNETDSNNTDSSDVGRALIADPKDRFSVRRVDGDHPSTVPLDALLAECHFRAQARSGPGGQHRNKTSSGVFLEHQPTGIIGEATERRSQGRNRVVAGTRLRFRLAVELRTRSIFDVATSDGQKWDGSKFEWNEARAARLDLPAAESRVRLRYMAANGSGRHGQPLRLGDQNADKPAVLALLLNDLHAAGGQPRLVGELWQTSTSSLVRFLGSHRPAIQWVNRVRAHHNRRRLGG